MTLLKHLWKSSYKPWQHNFSGLLSAAKVRSPLVPTPTLLSGAKGPKSATDTINNVNSMKGHPLD